MKKVFSLIATLTVLVLGMSLSSCTKEADLYGCWQNTYDEDEYIYISENGNFYECDSWGGSWSVSKQGYTFKKKDLTLANGDQYEVDLDGDILTLSLDIPFDFGIFDAMTDLKYKRCEVPAGMQEAMDAK